MIVLVCGLSVEGCGVPSDHYARLETQLATGQCLTATRYLSECEGDYGTNAKLIYLFDKGMINMLCGRYDECVKTMQEADDLSEKLWTISISKEITTFVVNDFVQEYSGEDFERAMINMVAAVNYALMGELDEALVECRRLDEKLSLFNQKYDKEKNVYKEDAFGRYLSGLLYESRGNLADAYIDYRKAYEAYIDYAKNYHVPMPEPLKKDLVRLAATLGHQNDQAEYKHSFGDINVGLQKDIKTMGRIVLIQFDARSPQKEEDRLIIQSPSGPITLAFPRFVVMPSGHGPATLIAEADGATMVRGESFLADDVEKIAIKNLADRMGRVITKTVARAITKQALIEAAARSSSNSQGNQMLVRQALNIGNLFIEQADTRSWRTLPGRVYLSTVFVKPGDFRVSAGAGRKTVPLGNISIRAGETRFVFLETMYN